jgi:integrase
MLRCHSPDLPPDLCQSDDERAAGQLLALRGRDVDLVWGSLSIQRSLVEGPDGPLLVPTKTRRSYRVDLDAASLELLRSQHRAASADEGATDLDNCFIFNSDKAGTRP